LSGLYPRDAEMRAQNSEHVFVLPKGQTLHPAADGYDDPDIIVSYDFDTLVEEYFDIQSVLLLSKHRDYGPSNIASAPGGALNGLRVRMHDKLARINHLIDSGAEPTHESLRDSFMDLANYAVIGLMAIDGKWPTK
jgi:hypothetical protein